MSSRKRFSRLTPLHLRRFKTATRLTRSYCIAQVKVRRRLLRPVTRRGVIKREDAEGELRLRWRLFWLDASLRSNGPTARACNCCCSALRARPSL